MKKQFKKECKAYHHHYDSKDKIYSDRWEMWKCNGKKCVHAKECEYFDEYSDLCEEFS